MDSWSRSMILAEALKVFFKALLAGYAGDGSGVKKEKFPDGRRIHTWEEGFFKVVDEWRVFPNSDWSMGNTTIFFKGNAVWGMSYGGCYPEAVIPFLKKALAEAYKDENFNCGRGPIVYAGDIDGVSLVYLNTNNPACNNFLLFSGEEKILKGCDSTILGFHKFFGMTLI